MKKFGKVRYIEPNDLHENGSYNVTHPQEDYCIAVDLTVYTPNRIYRAQTSNNNYSASVSSDNGQTVSFFGGDNGFLSDKPGFMTFKDVLNNKCDNESLGITNIHISYNSYFYPTVTINFIDVRGSGLMSSQEENYRRDIIDKQGTKKRVESFFSSFFSFPYPEFKLNVKGFYGKKVEYSLIVSDFKASFNNQTGNFEATVSFIGKMYGVYSDIPMKYLLIAPYCKYGSINNQTIWEQNNFRFNDGSLMPTFLELRDDILTLVSTLSTKVSEEDKKSLETHQNKLSLIQEIKNNYDLVKGYLTNSKNGFTSYYENNVILCPYNDNDKCKAVYGDTNSLENYIKELYDSIKKYTEKYKDKKSIEFGGIKDSKSIIGENSDYVITLKNENNNIKKTDGKYGFKDEKTFSNISNKIISSDAELKVDSNEKKFYVFDANDLVNTIKTDAEDSEKSINKIYNAIKEDAQTNIEDLLKFKPTIKNVFHILMAHLQTFMQIYERCISNIINESRTISEYGLNIGNTDISAIGVNNTDRIELYPFTAIKNEENEFCYPTTPILSKEIEENKLIDSLLDSTIIFQEVKDQGDKYLSELTSTESQLIPTCLTDITNGLVNPYEKFLRRNNSNIFLDWILFYFGMRCISGMCLETFRNAELFGKCEAYNLWRVNQDLKREIIDKINNAEFNSDNFIKFLLGEKNNRYIQNDKPCYATSDFNKLLTKYKNDYIIPNSSTQKYYPAIIGRDGGDINIFHEDMNPNKKNVNVNFQQDKTLTTPTNYIKLYDNNSIINEAKNSCSVEQIKEKYELDSRILNVKDLSLYKITSHSDIYNSKYVTFSEKDKNFQDDNRTYNFDNYSEDNSFFGLSKYYEGKDGDLISISGIDYNHFNFETDRYDMFLCLTTTSLEKLGEKLMDGNRIITLPYSTVLFLGMWIHYVKKGDENIIKKLINKWPSGRKSYTYFIKSGYDISQTGNDDVITSQMTYNVEEFISMLKCICCLTTNNKNERFSNFEKIPQKDGKNDKYTKPEDFFNTKIYPYIKENIIDKGYLDNDFLGLEEKYSEWRDSHSCDNYGYQYFHHNYCIFHTEWENTTDKFKERYKSKITLERSGDDIIRFNFNQDYKSYQYLNNFLKKTYTLILPYSNKVDIKIERKILENSFNEFKKQLLNLYGKTDEKGTVIDKTNALSSSVISNDYKLAIYQMLKNLYDKHLYDIPQKIEQFKVNSNSRQTETEFGRFHFIDTYFNDISDKLYFNIEKLSEVLNILISGYSDDKGNETSDMSVYSFMSLLCEKHHMMLLSLPVFNDFFKNDNEDGIKTMFKPYTYNQTCNENTLNGPSYVAFYMHQPSKNLEIPNSDYKNDGFNIPDLDDTNNNSGPDCISDLMSNSDSENDYIVPAFAVEYGVQKQSIFKNIKVNMDNPQTTEVAVANLFLLANKNNETATQIRFEGQDLYRIYSNYSYTCQVEMMGCSQILPLMYFQLNNIPMFRGAYQIIQVEHDITPGNMTTNFKGVRINKTKMPFVENNIQTINIEDLIKAKSIIKQGEYSNSYKDEKTIDIHITTSHISQYDSITQKITSDTLLNDFPDNIRFNGNTIKNNFDEVNDSLKKIIYCLLQDIKEESSSSNENLGIIITSGARKAEVNSNSASDHLIGSKSTSQRRKELNLNNIGCAIDLQGTKNKTVDKGDSSIKIFKILSKFYMPYIRQLIWELNNSHDKSANSINVIHVASYGDLSQNDKHDLFMAEKYKYSGKDLGNKNLNINFRQSIEEVLKQNLNFKVNFNNYESDNENLKIETLNL